MKTIYSILLLSIISTSLSGQCLETEAEFKDHFKKHATSIDAIEGIWSVDRNIKFYDSFNQLTNTMLTPQVDRVAIIRKGDQFITCSLNNTEDLGTVAFTKTAVNGLYLYERNEVDGKATTKVNANMTSSIIIEYSFEISYEQLKSIFGNNIEYGTYNKVDIKMVKLFPLSNESNASGTGFALTSDGYIVTNYHVIDKASTISVRGLNGNFENNYTANLIIKDIKNDLAIIKISDPSFKSLGEIPFSIQNKVSDVGSSVFCLGYPLRATMGDEVKITNGIVSAKTGFQGDITTYQISAPVQAGNSGGPLFNDHGELIGVISAKHIEAENATYAIKASYLVNLINNLANPVTMPNSSIIANKKLVDLVKIVRNYTYIIETN